MRNDMVNALVYLTDIYVITRFNIHKVDFKEFFKVVNESFPYSKTNFEYFRDATIAVAPNQEIKEYLTNKANESNSLDPSVYNLKDAEKYYNTINKLNFELLQLFQTQEIDQAYRFLDIFHNSPKNLSDKRRWNAKFFWKSEVELYRKSYNRPLYLIKEQQDILGKSVFSKLFFR